MKLSKLIAILAFAVFGLTTGSALAQGNENNTDEDPPMMNQTEATGEDGTNVETNSEAVSNDSGDPPLDAFSSEGGFEAQPERKEKLRVYSGKHDGNNVISDPR